jgi:dihydroflavonol-4-reductase
MKAFVTGASGFIGSEVVRQLLKQNVEVKVLLRKTSSLENLKELNFESVEGDLFSEQILEEAIQNVDVVFHLAGVLAARTKEEFLKHNALGTKNVAMACSKAGSRVKKLVYVSSLAAGGPVSEKKERNESMQDSPISAYGESKRLGEVEISKVLENAENRFDPIYIRPPIVYGQRDKAVFELIKIAKKGLIPLFPAYNSERKKYYSLIHVEDLVDVIVKAGLTNVPLKNPIFYTSGDGIHSLETILTSMAEACGRKKVIKIPIPKIGLYGIAAFYSGLAKITGKGFPITLDKIAELKPDYWICSNEKAKSELSFSPKYNLEQGILKTIQWYKDENWI